MVKTTIPPETVRILRSALLGEIGTPATCLEQASLALQKERRPELFHGPLLELGAIAAMLTALGFSEPEDPGEEKAVQLDFDLLRRVASDAMRVKRGVELDCLAKRNDAEKRTTAEESGELYRRAERDVALIEEFLAHHDPGER